MSQTFLEQRCRPLGNTFLNKGDSRQAHLFEGMLPDAVASLCAVDEQAIPSLTKRFWPSLLRRRNSIGGFIPYAWACAQEELPPTKDIESCDSTECSENDSLRHQDFPTTIVLTEAIRWPTREEIACNEKPREVACIEEAKSQNFGAEAPRNRRQPRGSLKAGEPCEGGTRTAVAMQSLSARTPQGDTRTTVMVRNIPTDVLQSTFMKELDTSGYKAQYDVCYLPCRFDVGKGRGYAFVNFLSAAIATKFMETWGGSSRFCASEWEKPISVTYANVQGKEKNLEKWSKPRVHRIRNPALKPFVMC